MLTYLSGYDARERENKAVLALLFSLNKFLAGDREPFPDYILTAYLQKTELSPYQFYEPWKHTIDENLYLIFLALSSRGYQYIYDKKSNQVYLKPPAATFYDAYEAMISPKLLVKKSRKRTVSSKPSDLSNPTTGG